MAAEIIAAADRLRAQTVGNEVHLRGLIEISNYCHNNCRYCGLFRDNRQLPRYRMSPCEIVASAKDGVHLGYYTIVLQAGEDPGLKPNELAAVIREIKSYGLVVTLSLGEREPWEYELWRKAGAERYLMRHETADAELYRQFHPGQDL
ncbi:MAG TPA: radical SAM protein, partial [Bacillota bacterium]|nr:radical SAM protein [Bacillota bacterium]